MANPHARSNCVAVHSRVGFADATGDRRRAHMADDFEDHCWKDIVPPDVLDIYTPLPPQDLRRAVAGAARHRPLRAGLPGRGEAGCTAAQDPSVDLRRERLRGDRADQAAVRGGARGRHPDLLHDPGHAAGQPAVARHRDQAPARAARSGALHDQAGVQAAAGRRGHHQAARLRLLRHAADGASDAARHPDRDRLRREHVGLRARVGGRRLFQRLPRRRWSRNAASTAACCRTRSTCSTCTTNTPTS